MTEIRYQSAQEEEQTPSYTNTDGSASDPLEWNVCESDTEVQDTEIQDKEPSPPNPFTYDGARPAAQATKRKNVILFGETGVGKSSVINLMAGAEIAATSSNLEACTLEATEYSFTLLGDTPLCVYDTVGLNEPEMGINTFYGAIEKAYHLIRSLHKAGGIDLLLFCVRGGRFTATMQRNYSLFFEFLCEKKVPLAFVVTHLEYEKVMEDWWTKNESTFEQYGIRTVAHACITAGPDRVATVASRHVESRNALQEMLHAALDSSSSTYTKDVRSWITGVIDRLRSYLIKNWMPRCFRRRYLLKRLEDSCGLSGDEAQQLADMLMRAG